MTLEAELFGRCSLLFACCSLLFGALCVIKLKYKYTIENVLISVLVASAKILEHLAIQLLWPTDRPLESREKGGRGSTRFPCVTPQPAIACSKLKIETLEEGVKYVQN